MTLNQIAKWLITIGAVNWGLVGIGYFTSMNLNVVNLLLGSVPVVEALVYVLVGLSALFVCIKMKQ